MSAPAIPATNVMMKRTPATRAIRLFESIADGKWRRSGNHGRRWAGRSAASAQQDPDDDHEEHQRDEDGEAQVPAEGVMRNDIVRLPRGEHGLVAEGISIHQGKCRSARDAWPSAVRWAHESQRLVREVAPIGI